jgi:ABC-type arginine transport system permease subunit
MFKTITSNLREILTFLLAFVILLLLLSALGSERLASSPVLSTFVSVATTIVGGALNFVTVLGLSWFGLAITLPEANKFIQSTAFDKFWEEASEGRKMAASLIAVAVLAMVSAICLSAVR